MKYKLSSPVSDKELGDFIFSCIKTRVEAAKLIRDIDKICTVKCADCHQPLTEKELQEARDNGLKIDEISCDKCWQEWMRQKMEDARHPDCPNGRV